MKKTYSFLLLFVGALMFTSCLSIAPTSISRNGSMEGYRYFYVTPTAERNSVRGETYGSKHSGVWGSTTSNSVNPADYIAGYLMGRGYIRVPEVKKEDAAQTMVINYGEGNMREGIFDIRAITVTLQILNGQTNDLLCVCKAEEKSGDEASATREAIEKALNEIFNFLR